MTNHDPYSYGQVRLDGPTKASMDEDFSLPLATRAPNAPASSWDLMDEDVDSLLPGNQAPAPAVPLMAPEQVPLKPRPAAKPRPSMGPQAMPAEPQAMRGGGLGERQEMQAAPATVMHALGRPVTHTRYRGRSSVTGLVVPTVVFGGGGTAAGWFYGMHQDFVMAGIVGALTLVATAFARVLLSR
jgi:hypothetical protein